MIEKEIISKYFRLIGDLLFGTKLVKLLYKELIMVQMDKVVLKEG